jgi:hypothetical protein
LARALEPGVTLFDTAEVYGPYMNEELLGSRWTIGHISRTTGHGPFGDGGAIIVSLSTQPDSRRCQAGSFPNIRSRCTEKPLP